MPREDEETDVLQNHLRHREKAGRERQLRRRGRHLAAPDDEPSHHDVQGDDADVGKVAPDDAPSPRPVQRFVPSPGVGDVHQHEERQQPHRRLAREQREQEGDEREPEPRRLEKPPQRRQQEDRPERIGAPGDVGDRLRVDGMHDEEERRTERREPVVEEARGEEIEQDTHGGMDEDAGQVEPAGRGAEHLVVDEERDPLDGSEVLRVRQQR
jgi:hypothetical protein